MPDPDRYHKLDHQESVYAVEVELKREFRTGLSIDDVSFIRKRERQKQAHELRAFFSLKFKESEENGNWPPFPNTVFGKLKDIEEQK